MKAYREEAGRQLIGQQAVQWLCDLRDGGETERTAFFAWLKQSPRHIEEFLLASATWKSLDGVGDAAGIEQAVAQARASDASAGVIELSGTRTNFTSRVKRNRVRWVAAAGLAALVSAALLIWSLLAPSDGRMNYTTAIGEQRAVPLADGSVLYLNTGSRVEVHYTGHERSLHLLEGEALFTVAPEPGRPFRVIAGPALIQVLGTQFNVRRRADDTTVSVVEGKVQVGNKTLAAGEEVRVARDGRIAQSAAPEIAAAIAWRERRLVFRGETLEQIAAEFNRYTHYTIRVEGDRARAKRLAGTFNADDPQALMLFLAKYPDLSIESGPQTSVIRDAEPASRGHGDHQPDQ